MDLSIVIVNWNTQDLLRDCLRSVFDGLAPFTASFTAEVIVVDNASADGSAAMVRAEFPAAQLIETGRNLGFAGGNNVALRRVTGRYVMLLNTDTLVHDDVLPRAVDWMDAHPSVGILGPRVLNADGSVQASTSAYPSLKHLAMQTLGLTRIARFDRYRRTGWDRTTEARVQVISGAAMVVRRAAMDQVGLLDEAFFFYGEETDWCHRFARAGWDLRFVPLPAITHFGAGAVRRLNHKRDVLLAQGTTRLHRKHGGLVAAVACFAILAAHNASRALLWQLCTLARRPGAADRARHFRAVTADLPRAWPMRGAR